MKIIGRGVSNQTRREKEKKKLLSLDEKKGSIVG
jgi:hypothetical protein